MIQLAYSFHTTYFVYVVTALLIIIYYKYNITTNKKFAMHNWLKTGRLLAKTTCNNIDETVASSSTIESQQVILKDAIPSCSITNVIEKNYHSNISEKSIVVPEIIELKSSKKRKYDESYLQFGFIPVGTVERPDGQCVICNVILQNSSLAPAKLKRHLETNLSNLMNKEMLFKKRKEEHNSNLSALHKYAKNDSENATEA